MGRACCTSLRPRATSSATFIIVNVQFQQRLMQPPLLASCSGGTLQRCSNNDEVTTDTDDIAMALPDTQGVNGSPVNKKKTPAARGMPRALYPSEKREFSWILRKIALDRCSATTTSDRADFTRTMSAASIAISFLRRWRSQGPLGREQARRSRRLPPIVTQRGPSMRGSRAASKPLALGSTDPSCSKLTVAAFPEGSTRATTWLGSMPTLPREHHHLFAHVPQCPDGGPGFWLLLVSHCHHQPNVVVHGNIHHKLAFSFELLLQLWHCGLPRCPTHGTNSAQPSHAADASGAASTSCQELRGIAPDRSAWSQSRWTRDIFVQDAICHLHNTLGQGVFATSFC